MLIGPRRLQNQLPVRKAVHARQVLADERPHQRSLDVVRDRMRLLIHFVCP